MGTKGTDKFREYREPTKKPKKTAGRGGSGEEGVNRCSLPIRSVLLEEVARCDYFARSRSVPPVGTSVEVREALVGGRVAVASSADNIVLGYLPVDLNYLRRCLEQGFRYEGTVTSASSTKTPAIRINLDARQI